MVAKLPGLERRLLLIGWWRWRTRQMVRRVDDAPPEMD
jgi:hypothetical protein